MTTIRNTNGKRIRQTVDGITSNWTYDERGNCTRFETSDGYWSAATFDAKNRLLSVQDVTGFTRTYKYDKFGNMTCKYSTAFGALK